MVLLGSSSGQSGKMTPYDIFIARLKLLIIMTRAELKSFPQGKYRKEALICNAEYVARDSMNWFGKFSASHSEHCHNHEIYIDYFLYQRINLLALMANALAEAFPVGTFRTKAIEDNIDYICKKIGFESPINPLQFLKVA
ncbi:MAG: hypothetical protein PHP23_05105 [Desulfobacterales bacterium]|nr:hypothetical protein [Desulfobacterales bacterium]MDD4072463.1 hypothetical protein [Desulfobacterales bacterium]MDD4393161.1 hypothetical protein [Desulfobacterales bacterium]